MTQPRQPDQYGRPTGADTGSPEWRGTQPTIETVTPGSTHGATRTQTFVVSNNWIITVIVALIAFAVLIFPIPQMLGRGPLYTPWMINQTIPGAGTANPTAQPTAPNNTAGQPNGCQLVNGTTVVACMTADGKWVFSDSALVNPTAQPTPADDDATPSATPESSAQPTAAPTDEPLNTGSLPELPKDLSHDGWTISANANMDNDPIVRDWLGRLKDPAPAKWKTFPNIPNPDVDGFRVKGKQVPDGVEYGTYDSPYCSSHPCDIPVGAWEYRYISGNYQFLGTECKGEDGKGCMLLLVNVSDVSYTFRNQDVDNGFTVRGRYWNGDALEWGVWGLVSHGSANMLNMPTMAHPDEVLNAGDPGNSGANCGNPKGCGSVDVRVVVVAADRILAVATTTVNRP